MVNKNELTDKNIIKKTSFNFYRLHFALHTFILFNKHIMFVSLYTAVLCQVRFW